MNHEGNSVHVVFFFIVTITLALSHYDCEILQSLVFIARAASVLL